MQLNPKQQEAATILSGPVLVLAGAGAGKTKTLTERIINLVESGILPQHIYDRSDSKRAIKEALAREGLDPKVWDSKKIISFISRQKGNGIRLADVKNIKDDAGDSYHRDTMIRIWTKYEVIKREDSAYDFDDLLLETAHLLKTNDQVREHYQRRWTHIHVDEYQDTNKVQHQIIRALTNKETNNIFAVGDPDQLIYGWRGAKLKNIMRFEKDFKDTQTVILEQNYRSTKHIIDASMQATMRPKKQSG